MSGPKESEKKKPHEHALFRFFNCTEATTGQIAAGVIVACFLTAHAATRRAELRPETTLPTTQAGNQAKGDEGVTNIMRSQDRSEGGLVWNRARNGRQAEISGGREKRVASQEYVMKIFESSAIRDGERKSGKRRECRHKHGGRHWW